MVGFGFNSDWMISNQYIRKEMGLNCGGIIDHFDSFKGN